MGSRRGHTDKEREGSRERALLSYYVFSLITPIGSSLFTYNIISFRTVLVVQPVSWGGPLANGYTFPEVCGGSVMECLNAVLVLWIVWLTNIPPGVQLNTVKKFIKNITELSKLNFKLIVQGRLKRWYWIAHLLSRERLIGSPVPGILEFDSKWPSLYLSSRPTQYLKTPCCCSHKLSWDKIRKWAQLYQLWNCITLWIPHWILLSRYQW